MRSGVVGGLLFLCLGLAAVLAGCAKTPFEKEQARAEAGNPNWLAIRIDTADKRHEYPESQYISIVTSYTSVAPYYYRVESTEGYSHSDFTDKLHLSDGREIPLGPQTIVCCASKLIGLNEEPYMVRQRARFRLKPGQYEMYLTTRRVFPWDAGLQQYEPSSFESASNLLKLRVVPDPGWQERAVAQIRQRLAANPDRCYDLSDLDAPAATAEKLRNIRNSTLCGEDIRFQETEYETALKGLEEMTRESDHGVTRQEVYWMVRMRVWLGHPELRQPPRGGEQWKQWTQAYRSVSVGEVKTLLEQLCGLLPGKVPAARTLTTATIKGASEAEHLPEAPCLLGPARSAAAPPR